MASSSSKPVWESLHQDLLDLILSKLASLSDYIRFSAVCKPWRSTALCSRNNTKLTELCSTQPPLLMVVDAVSQHPREEYRHCSFYNVTHKQILSSFNKFFMPYSNTRFCGSSHGWLIMVGYNETTIALYSPFYSRRDGQGNIPLPPIKPPFRRGNIHRGLLSVDPAIAPDDYIVFVWGLEFLAFIRPRDITWTFIRKQDSYLYIIYSGDLLYALCGDGSINSCDVSERFPKYTNVAPALFMREISVDKYIVEPVGGRDLLQVFKFYRSLERYASVKFRVFRLVVDDIIRETKWVEINSLGGGALFMDVETCTYVSSFNYVGCQPNSIYFICGDILSVFKLEDGSIRPLYHVGSMFAYRKWVVPKFLRNIKDLN